MTLTDEQIEEIKARTDIPLLISALTTERAALEAQLASLSARNERLRKALDALDRMSRGVDWCDHDEQARRWSAARRVLEACGTTEAIEAVAASLSGTPSPIPGDTQK